MNPIVIIPGWHDSPPGHWQSRWAQEQPGAVRVEQDDWHSPTRAAWVRRISQTVLSQSEPVVLVAHSLGCIAATHLSAEVTRHVAAALLVAPADPERHALLTDFAPVPYQRLPYRSIVVASNTDPFCPERTAGAYARAWGSEFVRLQDAGHINLDAGFGAWPLGWGLLQSLLAELAAPPAAALLAA